MTLFTSEQLANATSPETAVIVEGYPYGFRLRCTMRVWVEYKRGHGFRYCTQTSNPKREGVWNNPKRGTYSRVSMAIAQGPDGHLSPAGLSEYSDLTEYYAFSTAHRPALCPYALASLQYFREVKEAYAAACREEGVTNIYNATNEQRAAINRAFLPVVVAHAKAGTDY